MTTHLRRSTFSVLGALALWTSLEAAAQSSIAAVEPRSLVTALEIDRAAFAIDVAAERRVLDANIRSELARRAAAEREREPKLAAAGARPPG